MEHLKCTKKYMDELCGQYTNLNRVLTDFEKILRSNEKNKLEKKELQEKVNCLQIDTILLRDVFSSWQESKEKNVLCYELLQTCYGQLLQMEVLINTDQVKNISRYVMLCKQNEVEEELKVIAERNKRNLLRNASMEDREIVIDFRRSQMKGIRARDDFISLQRKSKEIILLWEAKLERTLRQRNNKIVFLVKFAQENMPQQIKLKRPPKSLEQKNLLLNSHVTLLSAKDFLKYFSNISRPPVAKSMTPAPIRSILVNHETQTLGKNPNIVKQVHFAPTPSYDSSSTDNNSANYETLADTIEQEQTIANNDVMSENPIIESVVIIPAPPKEFAIPKPVDTYLENDFNMTNSENNLLDFEHMFANILNRSSNNSNTNKLEELPNSSSMPVPTPLPVMNKEDDIEMSNCSVDEMKFNTNDNELNDNFLLNFSDDSSEYDEAKDNNYDL